jgi:hypothetical protein
MAGRSVLHRNPTKAPGIDFFNGFTTSEEIYNLSFLNIRIIFEN